MLNEFYFAAKGREWTESENWVEQQNEHCSWRGVTCNENGLVTQLILPSNGLSGKLDSNITKLSSLEVLDLSDNDIKVLDRSCIFFIDLELLLHTFLVPFSYLGEHSVRDW